MKVLLCSVGLSPQIVTEALFALRMRGWHPDRLLILTTAEGAAACQRLLLGPNGGLALYREKTATKTPAPEIAIVPSDNGDMDSERALASFADMANRLIGTICADPTSELALLLSGGRKMAAAYLALTLALHGRAQDRLFHVLTRPDMIAVPNFWFPTPGHLALSFGQMLDTSAVEVQLINIPFPRLGGMNTAGAETFAEVVASFNFTPAPRLIIDKGTVHWDGMRIAMPPHLAAWLCWLAATGSRGVPRVGAAREDYLPHYRNFTTLHATETARGRLSDPLDPEWMEEKAARLTKLGVAFGITPNGASLIHRIGEAGHARYRLALRPDEVALPIGDPP